MASIRATYLTDEGFTPENAKRASPAAEGLCKWVHAMSKYDKVSCLLFSLARALWPFGNQGQHARRCAVHVDFKIVI